MIVPLQRLQEWKKMNKVEVQSNLQRIQMRCVLRDNVKNRRLSIALISLFQNKRNSNLHSELCVIIVSELIRD